jgi:hypothetical protein
MPNFMKIRTLGAELFHADRRTDRHDEANNRFSQPCLKIIKDNTFGISFSGCGIKFGTFV